MAEGVKLYGSWTVDQLKVFLQERRIPLAWNKAEPCTSKVAGIVYADSLEEEIGVSVFQCVTYTAPPSFEQLPTDGWMGNNFPLVTESKVTACLKDRGGYTNNFPTEVCLCQCGHLFDLEMMKCDNVTFIKAKCRPTMRKNPPF